MTHPEYIQSKAVELRTERILSIDEIAERLALPRTTVFYWLRDLPIDRSARPRSLAQLNGSIAMQEKYRQLREAAYEEGRAMFDELALDASFRDFVCLYIAEGYKRNRNAVSVCNSDPAVVVLCDRWIRRLSSATPAYRGSSTTPIRTSLSFSVSGARNFTSITNASQCNGSPTAASSPAGRGVVRTAC